jgi:hypothetical protein
VRHGPGDPAGQHVVDLDHERHRGRKYQHRPPTDQFGQRQQDRDEDDAFQEQEPQQAAGLHMTQPQDA